MQRIAVLIGAMVVAIICLVGSLGVSKSIRNKESNVDRIAKEITALGVEVKVLKEKIYFFAMEKNDKKFDKALAEFMKRYSGYEVKSKDFTKNFPGFGSGYRVIIEEKKDG